MRRPRSIPPSKTKTLAALGLALLAFGSARAHGELIGDSVHGRFLFPDTSTVYAEGGTQTIANGTMFDFSATAGVTVAFSDTEITVTNTSPDRFVGSSFSGIDLAFLSGPAITSVTEGPASSLLFAAGSILIFSGNDIRLNLAGTCTGCVGGEKIFLEVTTAAVPEPASAALLGVGLLGLAWRRFGKPG